MRAAAGSLAIAALAGCGGDDGPTGQAGSDRLSVVAGLAPFAEIAELIGGERVAVESITPAGAEPHDVELSPDQVADLEDAAVVVVVGGGFQPAVEDVADRTGGEVVSVLDQLEVEGDDPHVWLDPVLMQEVVDAVTAALEAADPDGAEEYRRNGAALAGELDALDRRYTDRLASCERRLLVTAHDAFGRLAERYDLDHEGIAGVSPDSEPDPRRLSELTDLVRDEGVTTVFTEELLPPEVAEALAREADVGTAVLDPIESLADGATYIGVMDANLDAITEGLGCG